MSQLDALLERSRTPGAFVTRKRFTLARHKAIEKMREFALRHPRQYVLELVQAAVFAGATWIAIDVRDDSILVGWVGGKTLSAQSLENIFDYLFVDQADLERRHLMQLAVGLNAIYQRKPSVVRIESGDGTVEGTARMELDRKGAVQVGKPEAGLGGTYLYVEFYSGWWERFLQTGTSDEPRLVEERCLYTPVPILLNGSAPFGYRSNRHVQLFGVTRSTTVEQERLRGAIGLVRSNVAPQFRIVVGGVWVGTDELPELGTGLGGVIADDSLRKTADMSDIVRDERWVRMLHAVQPAATELLREVRGRGYTPPALPPMPEIREIARADAPAAPAAPVAVPIEGAIDNLGPRPDLALVDLHELPQGAPVFWVDKAQAAGLERHGDPAHFPFHVLQLSEGEATWLSEKAPHVALSRLATSADFGFVQRILTRRAITREASAPLEVGPARGTLHLRLHVEGRMPFWGVGAGTPALVSVNGQTVDSTRLPLELGPVSVRAELDRRVDADDLSVALVRQTLAAAWRLVDAEASDAATVRLLRAVLALHARPTFVELEGVKSVDAVLPNDWGRARQALRRATLAHTTEGPLSLDGLLALINEERVATLRDHEELDELAQLEEAFGPGHLHHPTRTRFPLVAVARTRSGWRPVDDLDKARPLAVIGLRDSLAAVPPEPGWTRVQHLAPVEIWVRELGVDDLDEGLRLLADRLASLIEEPTEHLPERLRNDRARSMMRLGLLRLAASAPVELQLRATSGELADLDGEGLMIAPLHGPQVVEHDTIALSFDELRALEAVRGRQVLRFDDPASVWHDLTEDGEGWLLRHEIRVPGVEGWIGLRFPYDPTAAILVETSRALLSLGEVDRQAPCHGLLWARSTTSDLKHAQVELVRLAAIQLYQRLLEILDGDLVGLGREAAVHYAAGFALRTAARKGSLPSGTARELAAHVDVPDADGVRWGTLERWLDAEPSLRPPLPEAWARHYHPERGDDLELVEADDVPERIARRLRSALSALSRDVWVDGALAHLDDPGDHVRVSPHESTSLRVAVRLNEASLAVQLAHSEPRIFEMLLLETARQVAMWRDDHIHFEDLARMLVAQRITA